MLSIGGEGQGKGRKRGIRARKKGIEWEKIPLPK